MTERKPPGMTWETWTQLLERQGMERGELEVDPSWTGRPLPGKGEADDELWWVRRKLRDEDVQYLPPALAIRIERDEAKARIAAATSEADVRRLIAEINEKIAHVNRTTISGPPSTVAKLDVEETVERWRTEQGR